MHPAVAVGLVFGGCCSNVVFLELLARCGDGERPRGQRWDRGAVSSTGFRVCEGRTRQRCPGGLQEMEGVCEGVWGGGGGLW